MKKKNDIKKASKHAPNHIEEKNGPFIASKAILKPFKSKSKLIERPNTKPKEQSTKLDGNLNFCAGQRTENLCSCPSRSIVLCTVIMPNFSFGVVKGCPDQVRLVPILSPVLTVPVELEQVVQVQVVRAVPYGVRLWPWNICSRVLGQTRHDKIVGFNRNDANSATN